MAHSACGFPAANTTGHALTIRQNDVAINPLNCRYLHFSMCLPRHYSVNVLIKSLPEAPMRVTLSPYLNFDGQCRQALSLYHACFGGELKFQTVADSPPMPLDAACADRSPNPQAIVHGHLVNQDFMILGTDMNGPAGYRPGNDFGFGVSLDSEDSLRRCLEILAGGGTITVPPGPTPWADLFAALTDRFGKRWYLNYFGSKSPQ